MKNLIFSQELLNLISRRTYDLQIIIKDWIETCIKETVPGNILLIYDRNYHGLSPQWEEDLAKRLDLRSDKIYDKTFYPDREILNQICRELDRWVKLYPEEAKTYYLAISQVGLCIVCPGKYKFK